MHSAQRRRNYLVHLGPKFLVEVLTKETVERRREVIPPKPEYRHIIFLDFDHIRHTRNMGFLLPPADKYQGREQPRQLSYFPKSEQPSRGWEWFCREYEIPSLGVPGEMWFNGAWAYIIDSSYGRELGWGFPFWDGEKLDLWGIVFSPCPDFRKRGK